MNVRIARLGALPIVGLVFAIAALPATAEQSRDLNWNGPIAAGTILAISGLNGSISAEPTTGAEASVQAHATSKLGDLSKVRLQVKQSGNTLRICTVTPYENVSEDCSSRHSSENVDGDHAIRIDLTVHVPRGIVFEARTVNGKIRAQGLSGPVLAKTVNGSIEIATAANAQAKTVNGSIDVRLGEATWPGDLRFATVNGSINVALPASASFSLNARTLNGTIDAQAFGLAANRRFVGRSLDGTVGSNAGGKSITLKTVNGSIALTTLGAR
jgi:DUF4097 and DUF4098 domain-containing protein YvlB